MRTVRGAPVRAADGAYGHALFFSRGTGGSFFSGCGVLTALSGYSDGRQDRHEAGAGAAGAGRQDQHPVYHRFHGVSQGRLQRPPHPVPAQAGFPGRSGAGDQNGFAVISSAPHRNLPGGRQDLCPAGRGYPLR